MDLQRTDAAIRFLSAEPLLEDLGDINLCFIHWAIVGGESGPGTRPMQESWILNLKELCERLKVDFFFKQWSGVRKKEAGRLLQGEKFSGMPFRHRQETPIHSERNRRIRMIVEMGQ